MHIVRRAILAILTALQLLAFGAGSLLAQTITSLSPTSGTQGTQVTITGTGFGATRGSNYVMFATTKATIDNWSDTSIVAVPTNDLAATVNVYVDVAGVESNEVQFTLTNPEISTGTSTTNAAPVGQEITITGIDFGSSQGPQSSVTFNGVTATPSSWSSTLIEAAVPEGASTGPMVVTVDGVPSAGFEFMVTPAPQPPGVHFIQGNYTNHYLGPNGSPPNSAVVSFPIGQTAGDLNVVVVSWEGTNSVNTVTDTAGNRYAVAVGPTTGSVRTQVIYYAKNIFYSDNNTITVTFSSTPATPGMRIAEYSNLDPSNPVDVTAASYGTVVGQFEIRFL
jgi:hypothetical protein